MISGPSRNPAAVNLSAKLRPVSSRRQSGVPGFAWISRAKPSFTSLAPWQGSTHGGDRAARRSS